MANMFSGNAEKKVPGDLKSCYRTDPVAENLWIWSERLERWGMWLCVVLFIVGIVTVIHNASEASKLIKELGLDSDELKAEAAKLGIEIKSVGEVVFDSSLNWAIYCFLEFCAYHILALLVGSLASIVQHTRITANIALYKAAKAEGFTEESNTSSNENSDNTSEMLAEGFTEESNTSSNENSDNTSEMLNETKENENEEKRIHDDVVLTVIVVVIMLIGMCILYFLNK